MISNIPLNKINLSSGGAIVQKPFITTWKTDNVGTSEDNEISLPFVSGGSYDCIVDWGDGNSNEITAYDQEEVTHTYSSPGTYTVKIRGQCEGFRFNDGGDKLKLLTVEQWGVNFKLNAAGGHFFGCSNLVINAIDKIDIGTTTNLSQAFRDCAALDDTAIKFKDTSNVTTLWACFYGCNNFNGNLDTLTTENCQYLNDMFGECHKFNQPVNHFDTSNVTSLYAMFYGCYVFNQPVDNWDTSNVTNMISLFNGCAKFNQDISNFDTSGIRNSLAGEIFVLLIGMIEGLQKFL